MHNDSVFRSNILCSSIHHLGRGPDVGRELGVGHSKHVYQYGLGLQGCPQVHYQN